MVTAPHSRWLELTEDEQIPSDEALEFVVRSLKREFKKTRPGRIFPPRWGSAGAGSSSASPGCVS